ncbi:MAG: hypothetical protein HWE33_06515 [Rhodobacteraceae bacterium]|nr:hypothetical protein [Paracoccaceae bacterium]
MSVSNLTSFWESWRLGRFHEFINGGMPQSSADEVSRGEAAARQSVELHAGREAALAAGLSVVPDEAGGEKLVLMVPPDLIPADRIEEAEMALYVSGVAVRL